MKIQWNEQGKVRVRETRESQIKHLLVKAAIVFYIKFKHRNRSHAVKVYTEWPVGDGKVCDVYYENSRDKEAIAYEVQARISDKWLKETEESYKNWEVHGMKSVDYIIIDLSKLSNNMKEMVKQVKELVI